MRHIGALTIIATLAALTACSGGSTPVAKSPAKPKTFAVAVTPAQVADDLGCGATFQDTTTDEIYVQAVGTCDYKTFGTTRILTFANDTARDSFIAAAESFGGQYVKGHDYAIEYPG